jgi:capsule polysaccharide export protein KpsE/RkpR
VAIGIDDERPAGRYVDAPEMWRSRSGNAFSASWAWLRAHSGFTVIVVIPSLLGALYYFVIAAPIYASYAQFEVKEASQNTSLSGLGSFLQATGVTNVTNDAYTVDTYLQSRDALRELVKNPGIDKIYARPEADFLVHFPAFYMPSSFEYLWWHYTWWTSADLNTDSNVTTLSVYAFRPKDANSSGPHAYTGRD